MRFRLAFLFLVSAAPLGAQGRITGTVFDSLLSNGPLAQATVLVVGTNLSRVTDARGRFQIDSVPAGRLQLTFFHSRLDSIGVGAGSWEIEVAAGTETRANLSTPSGTTMRRTLCPELVDSGTRGVLMGRVREVDQHTPLAGARVSSSWMEVLFSQAGPTSEKHEVSVASVSSGAFALCGVPLDVPVFVRASIGDQASGPVEIFANSRPVLFQDLAISLTDTVARLSVDSAISAALIEQPSRPPGTATLVGHVRDPNARPIAGARVALHGGGSTAVADREGAFRLRELPAGTQTFDIRAIGFTAARRTVDLATSASTTVTWELDRGPAQLPTVTVRGGSRLERNGFNARARQGHGSFLTEAQIEKMGGFSAMDVLGRVTGLTLEYRNSGGARGGRGTSVRVPTMRKWGQSRCVPAVFVDGGLWLEGWGQVGNFLTKADVQAIEVYSSLLTIPPQFDRRNGCGSVVIWTRP